MSHDQTLSEKIYWILIEAGQKKMELKIGDMITFTPTEIRYILRDHEDELVEWAKKKEEVN